MTSRMIDRRCDLITLRFLQQGRRKSEMLQAKLLLTQQGAGITSHLGDISFSRNDKEGRTNMPEFLLLRIRYFLRG